MIVMVFEYELDNDPGVIAAYEAMSDDLRSRLPGVPGGVEIERFESCTRPGHYLALGTFINEEAVADWRTESRHREAQRLGREQWMTDYRLRMAEVLRDYGPRRRGSAPADALAVDSSQDDTAMRREG